MRKYLRLALVLATALLMPVGSQATAPSPSEEAGRCMIWWGGVCGCSWIQSCPNNECGNPETGECKAVELE